MCFTAGSTSFAAVCSNLSRPDVEIRTNSQEVRRAKSYDTQTHQRPSNDCKLRILFTLQSVSKRNENWRDSDGAFMINSRDTSLWSSHLSRISQSPITQWRLFYPLRWQRKADYNDLLCLGIANNTILELCWHIHRDGTPLHPGTHSN